MLDKSKVYWGCMVHYMGMNTRPSKVYYDPDEDCYKTDDLVEDTYWKLGMHKDGPSNPCVAFLSKSREEVIIWMKGVAAAMATVHEWAKLGGGYMEAADHFGDYPSIGEYDGQEKEV